MPNNTEFNQVPAVQEQIIQEQQDEAIEVEKEKQRKDRDAWVKRMRILHPEGYALWKTSTGHVLRKGGYKPWEDIKVLRDKFPLLYP